MAKPRARPRGAAIAGAKITKRRHQGTEPSRTRSSPTCGAPPQRRPQPWRTRGSGNHGSHRSTGANAPTRAHRGSRTGAAASPDEGSAAIPPHPDLYVLSGIPVGGRHCQPIITTPPSSDCRQGQARTERGRAGRDCGRLQPLRQRPRHAVRARPGRWRTLGVSQQNGFRWWRSMERILYGLWLTARPGGSRAWQRRQRAAQRAGAGGRAGCL
jgi:hypothetical protein